MPTKKTSSDLVVVRHTDHDHERVIRGAGEMELAESELDLCLQGVCLGRAKFVGGTDMVMRCLPSLFILPH